MVAIRTVRMAMGYFFGRRITHIDNLDVKLQARTC
jgi:hypothetical protein